MASGEQTSLGERQDQDQGEALSWIVHPAIARPLRAMAVVGLLFAVSLMVYYVMGSPWWMVLSSVILLLSLRQFFLPTSFRLTDEAVISRFLWFEKKKEWTHFRSYFADRNGVLLSPFPGPSRLENFRGFYLLDANRQPGALEFIRKKLKPEKAS